MESPRKYARKNSKEDTADMLKEWLENRDRALGAAEAGNASRSGSGLVADKGPFQAP
jgi:hypothetical protein